MTPQWLVGDLAKNFGADSGRIMGSTATFGAPFYGDRVQGRLVWGDSLHNHTHCEEDDYVIPPPKTELVGQTGQQFNKVKLINIVMVRRGSCSFTTKVKVAQKSKDAHAVIIVDKEDSNLKTSDMPNIIVADDGYGGDIHIPSVLIAKAEGRKLIEAAKREEVIIELAWDLPTQHVVTVDMWMSSASQMTHKFLKEFKLNRMILNEVMVFNPHYAVFPMDGNDPAIYSGLCSDQTGRFCAEDPDGAGQTTGRDVLEENVRQLCIHEKTKVPRVSNELVGIGGQHPVEYSKEFWEYITKYLDECPLEGTDPNKRFGETCSLKVMREVGIATDPIIQCAMTSKDDKLMHERENPAWSPRAVRINGWRYSGYLNADLVSRAVCSAFINSPLECKQILDKQGERDYFMTQMLRLKGQGVSFTQMLMVLLLMALLGFIVMILYKRYLRKELQNTLREEVMLEVQAQMGEYSQLKGHA
eukprot:CAMPEP_0197629504 /NCGR_PEP_ID=MMETSP1338-20131121/7322_1 /TAXON_ID=43686 ORGANISM="Pelagodinium beii, Strain RCC1491" /NCGR_SAMPLE_ID=MMETSP1338 /ASSEMBLY_ACC=CAM_ASM_000754 /LENGTH=471 /DNA_ID=CAMNT_0043200549 /DNA_START=111 /DNA_END=1526 /DNA_ORIENTATION=-